MSGYFFVQHEVVGDNTGDWLKSDLGTEKPLTQNIEKPKKPVPLFYPDKKGTGF